MLSGHLEKTVEVAARMTGLRMFFDHIDQQ
jgi:hypothetical protein